MTEEPAPITYPSGIPKPHFDAPVVTPEVMILTGMSGAGRTRAAATLGDLGWYVVDNLPPQLLGGLVAMVGREPQDRLAVVVDVRGGDFFQDVEPVVDDLATRGIQVRTLFLDASDEALVRRFDEARRPHPLQENGTLLEGIGRERALVAALKSRADEVVDTTDLNVHELRDAITAYVGHTDQPLSVNIVSFGFRNGLPADADFVADVRFLPNPHWVPALRPQTGLDTAVRNHVLSSDGAGQFLDTYTAMLESVLALYRAHDKHSVTIAIGCTGGKHRSVAIAEEIGTRLRLNHDQVRVTHRDRPTE
jgi:UPF0042 nucleotide-binding protein